MRRCGNVHLYYLPGPHFIQVVSALGSLKRSTIPFERKLAGSRQKSSKLP